MQNKNRSRFTVVDMAIIITVSALFVSILLRGSIVRAFSKIESAEVSYVFEIPAIAAEKASAITEGTFFTEDATSTVLGEVTAITSIATSTTYQILPGGNTVEVLNPDFRSVIGTATVTLDKKADGYYTPDGKLFASGCAFEVSDGVSAYTIRIAKIDTLE